LRFLTLTTSKNMR